MTPTTKKILQYSISSPLCMASPPLLRYNKQFMFACITNKAVSRSAYIQRCSIRSNEELSHT